MIKFNDKKALEWEIKRENKFKYILTRAIIYGSILSIGISLFVPAYVESLFQTVIISIISLLLSSATFGLLSALGDWKINEERYQIYLTENAVNGV